MNIQEVRAKYPQYSDLSDQQLADALHSKFYADMPKNDFYTKVGLKTAPSAPPQPFVPSGEKTSGWLGGIFGYDPKALGITPAENIAGHPFTRFALGAASPVVGATQLASEAFGSDAVTNQLREVEALKNRGAQAMGAEGADIAGAAGTILSPAFLKAGQVLKAAPTVGGRIAQGTGIGAAAGTTAPVTEGEDYWTSKGGQVLIGTLFGGAIPGAIEAGGAGVRGVTNIVDMLRPGGAERILTNYQRRIVGPENVAKVVEAIRAPRDVPHGYEQTAAERLVGTPAGSPIAAHQRITAQTPGGISAQFGERFQSQKTALTEAAKARDRELIPVSENIISKANAQGVETSAIIGKIDAMLAKPGQRASDVVQKTLNAVKEKIAAVGEHGVVDARDLWTIRKELGNTISTHAKETANWDKRLTSGLERNIQKTIDDAIEGAGGVGWKQFMAEYAKRSQAIGAAKEAAKLAYRPAQRTELGGGVNVAEETRTKMPQLLSRPMMITNFVLKKLGAGIEDRLDPAAAQRYLNPEKLAEALEKVPLAQRPGVVQDLIRLGRIPALGGGIAAGDTQ